MMMERTFETELPLPSGREVTLEIAFIIHPPDPRAGVAWHWPEVTGVWIIGSHVQPSLPESWFEKMEDAIYQATEQYMESIPAH